MIDTSLPLVPTKKQTSWFRSQRLTRIHPAVVNNLLNLVPTVYLGPTANRLSESPAGLQFRGVEESGHVHVLVLGRGIHIGPHTDLSARYSLIWQPTTSLKHSSDSQ